MSKVISGLLLAVLLFSLSFNVVFANPSYAARCDNCTGQQAKTAATAIAPFYKTDPAATAAGYWGFVYVYDFSNGNITQYGVVQNQKQGQLVAMYVGVAPAEIASAFHIQRNAILSNGSAGLSFEFHDTTASHPSMPDGGSTAIDVVWTSSIQNAIGLWMVQNASTNAWAIIAAAESVVLKDQAISVDVVWTMSSDHSQIKMRWTPGAAHQFVLLSAMDAFLNNIPMTDSQVPGKYRFGTGGSSTFTGYLHDRFGYSIGPTCVNGQLACSSVADQRTCVWVNCNGQ